MQRPLVVGTLMNARCGAAIKVRRAEGRGARCRSNVTAGDAQNLQGSLVLTSGIQYKCTSNYAGGLMC